MGRNKTLPPSTMVALLIPNSMLAMLDANRFEGRKGCSAFSRSEAIRDAIAKGLGITWKPVVLDNDDDTMTDAKATAALVRWAEGVSKAANTRTSEHWTRQVKKVAQQNNISYDLTWWFRAHIINQKNVLSILQDHFPNQTPIQLHARLILKR